MNKIKILSGFGLMFAFSQVWAGAITGITVDSPSTTERIVKITFDGPAAVPSSFATANPPRIALDFARTSVKMPNPQLNLNDSVIKMATAAENNGRARVLLGLSENSNYTTQVDGDTLLVKVNSKSADIAFNSTPIERNNAADSGVAFPAAKSASVDFRRTETGAGRLELTLPHKDAPVDVNRVGDKVVITLLGNQISAGQLRKFSVNDFATPARNVDVFNDGRNGKIIIGAKGNWTFASFQTPDKLVVEVSEKLVDKDGRSVLGGQKFTGQKLSLNFQNVEVRTVLQVIAEFTKLNIVVSDKVSGSMTLRLTDVPWDQALNLIMESKNLTQHKEGNIVQIETIAEYNERMKAKDVADNSGVLEQRIFKLKYKDVESFKTVLKLDSDSGGSSGATLLSGRGSALFDPGTNSIVINDVRSVIQKMEQLINELDVAKRQVMIEARIVEAKDEFSRSFGVKFGGMRVGNTSIGGNGDEGAWSTGWDNNLSSKNMEIVDGKRSGSPIIAPNVSLPSTGDGGVFGIFHAWSSYAIGLELSASQLESKTRIVSTPRILTADREEGSIEEGTDIPYQESTSSGATSTSFKKATTSLKVTPQITPDGNIIMDVEVTKDSPSTTLSSNGELALDVRQIKTKATVEDGGTIVIGGMYVQDEGNTAKKVPFLGDIPILGNLFKFNNKTDSRRELLVFLTPRILADVDAQARYR